MKNDLSLSGNNAKYTLIVSELRDAIERGHMLADEQLPGFPKMLERYNVARHTLEKAYVVLEREGLIRREQGRGVFVESLAKGKKEGEGKKKETGLIGYLDLLPHYSGHSPYMLQVQKGMRQAASQANKHLVLIDSPQAFSQWHELDGLLLCDGGKVDRRQLRELLPNDLPVANLLYNDPVFPSVVADDAMGSRLMVEHLISLGHRQIGFMGFHRHVSVDVRYQAYREALLRNGIEPRPELVRAPEEALDGSFCEAGHLTMQRWLNEGFESSDCTALLTQNDQVAFGAVRALQEAGVSVFENFSVTGFDGVPHVVLDGDNDEYWQPLNLTTIKVPLAEIAGAALKAVSGGGQLPPVGSPIVLPVELQKGESSTTVSDSYHVVCTH